MRHYYFLFVVISFLILLSCSSEDPITPTTTTKGTIKGKIFNQTSGNGILEAIVVTQPATVTVTSDSVGNYSIPNIEPGNYILNATKDGYFPNSVDANVSAGETTTINISLANIPVTIASFTYTGQTVTPATITFQNTSQNADTYLWDFGDDSTSTEENPSKTYSIYGTYTVTLTASNTVTGLYDQLSHDIIITPRIVYVDTIWLLSFPPTKPNGDPWDPFNGPPDVYANIVDSVGIIRCQTNLLANVALGDLPVYWNSFPIYAEINIPISNWDKTYFVDLWDDDTGILENDYMGITGGFKVNQLTDYPAEVELHNAIGNLKVTLVLRWE